MFSIPENYSFLNSYEDFRGNEKYWFTIPKNFQPLYDPNVTLSVNAPKALQDMAASIRETFNEGVTVENYGFFFHNLLWYEEMMTRINLKNYKMSGVPLTAIGEGYKLHVPGLADKRPSLVLGDMLLIRPHEAVIFEAVVANIVPNYIIIKPLCDEFHRYYTTEIKFDVRFVMSPYRLTNLHNAVEGVKTRETILARLFPLPIEVTKKSTCLPRYFNHLVEKNEDQRTAVEHIMAGTSGMAQFLLHGPPGTGKTVTIVEAILQLALNPQNHIMVCTESNAAADHITKMILDYKNFLPSNKLLLRANSKFRAGRSPRYDWDDSDRVRIENCGSVPLEEFLSYKIIVVTLLHAARYARLLGVWRKPHPITHLFIDEAAQACEPACLIPICGFLSSHGTLVLAGDPLQLGPVVISHTAKKKGLGVSLMERLMNNFSIYSGVQNENHYSVMLRQNYRSDPDILEIPNEMFYNKQLIPLAQFDELSKTDILQERPQNHAIVFHGVLSTEQRMGNLPSYFNERELEVVQMYINKLLLVHSVLQEDIGIVTPYLRQVHYIKMWLHEKSYDEIEVCSVETFQGKEKRVIIISTVRANHQLGFLVDHKRFNVALTRAKAKAIVIGNPLCLQRDVKWRKYMYKCRELGTYYGIDFPEYTIKEMVDRETLPAFENLTIKETKKLKRKKKTLNLNIVNVDLYIQSNES